MRKIVILVVLVAMLAAAVAPAAAQSELANSAGVLLVHGIPGNVLVDVRIGNECVVTDLAFNDEIGIIPVPAGAAAPAPNRPITVFNAAAADECSGTPLVGPLVFRPVARALYTVVVHTTVGANATPTATLVRVPTTQTGTFSRAVVIHAANAPAVDVRLSTNDVFRYLYRVFFRNLSNGQVRRVLLPEATYDILIRLAGTTTNVALAASTPTSFSPDGNETSMFIIVGAPNADPDLNTLQVIYFEINNGFPNFFFS